MLPCCCGPINCKSTVASLVYLDDDAESEKGGHMFMAEFVNSG